MYKWKEIEITELSKNRNNLDIQKMYKRGAIADGGRYRILELEVLDDRVEVLACLERDVRIISMTKQISTYGAALLTAMVIIRAATIDNQIDLSDRYQRLANLTYVEDNLAMRYDNNATDLNSIGLLAFNVKHTVEFSDLKASSPQAEEATIQFAIIESENNSIDEIELDPIDLELLVEEVELNGVEDLSLDRESTINSGLSVIFNRERIHPKPTRISLQE